MPKTHFCKNFIDFVQCSETNSDKFEFGRYSICRKCRSLNSCKRKLEIQENIKDEKIKEQIKEVIKNEDLIEDKTIVDFVIDSRKIVSDVAQNSHIYKIKKEHINQNFNSFNENIKNLSIQLSSLNELVKNLEQRVKFLEIDNQEMREKLDIKEKIIQEGVTVLKHR
jgi:hypothetical protein